MRSPLPHSPIGFGTYRVHDRDLVHREALKQALLDPSRACRLIDTSSNYMNGASELLIGQVLRELFDSGSLSRQDVTVVTKAGYVQGDNLDLARERVENGNPFPEMVEFSPECWHCISPEFLEDQITRSLKRLGLECVDALLLHNPEYFLKAGGDHGEYYRRIEAAFAHLEEEARTGRIGCYGISSNTFPSPKDAPDYTSLETVLEIARRFGPGNRFQVIQFPFNLLETGAVTEENNSGKTVARLALESGLQTLVNRPLNAFSARRLFRLAEFPSHLGTDVALELQKKMEAAHRLEAELEPAALDTAGIEVSRIAWGHVLKRHFETIQGLDHWQQLLERRIRPELSESLAALQRSGDERLKSWAGRYAGCSAELFGAMTAFYEAQAWVESRSLAAALDSAVPALAATPTLSRKAVRILRSFPGIDCILVGMRKPEYVQDVLSLDPPLSEADAWKALEAVPPL